MSERFRNLKLALAGGVVITSAAVLGTSAECGGDKKEPNTPTAVIRTYTPENPTVTNTTEATKTPISEIALSGMNRDNYLSVFESDEFFFQERDVLREPTDDARNFIRTYKIFDEGATEHGVTIEKVEKDTGNVVGEFKTFDGFIREVGPLDSKQKALGVIFLLDQDTKGHLDTLVPESDSSSEYVAAILMRGKECLLAKYEVNRESGKYARIASEVGQVAEGECE